MPAGFLWIEGVNFDATIHDSGDLSTMRGASMALIGAGRAICGALVAEGISFEIVIDGASTLGLRISAADDTEKTERVTGDVLSGRYRGKYLDASLKVTLPFLSFVTGSAIAADDGREPEDRALAIANARARRRQYADWTWSPSTWADQGAKDVEGPCPVDRMRPATEDHPFPNGTAKASRATHARRQHGRTLRQLFYRQELSRAAAQSGLIEALSLRNKDRGAKAFIDDFQSMVSNPPDMAETVRGKIAVFYADGNSFTKIREEIARSMASRVEAQRQFSAKLRDLQGASLLPALLQPFVNARDGTPEEPGDPIDQRRQRACVAAEGDAGGPGPLRLETLMWGGDEIRLVVPAWLALDLARIFFAEVGGPHWNVAGKRLTFSAGLAIASVKTPIRSLIDVAGMLCDDAKRAQPETANKLSIEVFESIEPPIDGAAALRWRRFGSPDGEKVPDLIRSGFVLNADHLDETLQRLSVLKHGSLGGEGLPRSQLARLLRLAREGGLFTQRSDEVEQALGRYLKRAGEKKQIEPQDLRLETAPLFENRPLGHDLYMVEQLWDYLPEPSVSLLAEADE